MKFSEKNLKEILKKGHIKLNKINKVIKKKTKSKNEKINNNTSVSTANLEQAVWRQSLGTKEYPRFDSQVDIHIRSLRHRLADTDGISEKAAIDGIVKIGILGDDSYKEIRKISQSQEKTSKKKDEKTIITIAKVEEYERS
jgi:hypothetical protein